MYSNICICDDLYWETFGKSNIVSIAIEVDEVRPIKVDTTAAGRPDAPCHVTMTNPRGEVFELPAQKIPEGYEAIFAPLEPGPHLVNVNFAGKEVPKSPFPVTVEPKCDVGAVDVLGLETRKSRTPGWSDLLVLDINTPFICEIRPLTQCSLHGDVTIPTSISHTFVSAFQPCFASMYYSLHSSK